ncbi:MAG: GTPase Era [Xylanivirga thermophila]|jgi:GTPase|uniref:GTPase Era n=1 Tax=Xylanivirga thermophila TaxID=2496273 RepID=UPI00101B5E59|nr:GTPase Era [Xylanivirga thermophila]
MGKYHSGFVSIIGRPNVGKSTLMNAMIGEKIAIISNKPQTTRNRIQCVLTRPEYQIVFIDTPGLHKPKNKLGEYMVNAASSTLDEVDAILFVVDIKDGIGGGDKRIIEMLKGVKAPIILAANKIDGMSTKKIDGELSKIEQFDIFDRIVKVSASTGENLNQLEDILRSYMPEGPQYYPPDMITDQPERIIIAELIREKALNFLREEIPHGIGVEIMHMEERDDKNIIDINATIYCEKNSHKSIIIGKGGSMLKAIGSSARSDIEKLLDTHVYLELWVKVKDDWRNSPGMLRTLGYK